MTTIDTFHALQPFTPDVEALYTVEEAAHLAGVPRHFVLVCYKHGLVAPQVDAVYGALLFDHEAVRALQRIGYLHDACGVNLTGIKIILELMAEVEQLREAYARARS